MAGGPTGSVITLPMTFRGRAWTKRTSRGRLWADRDAPTGATSSAPTASGSVTGPVATTHATIRSPRSASGSPTRAHRRDESRRDAAATVDASLVMGQPQVTGTGAD